MNDQQGKAFWLNLPQAKDQTYRKLLKSEIQAGISEKHADELQGELGSGP